MEPSSDARAMIILYFFSPEDGREEGSKEAEKQQVILLIYLIIYNFAKDGHPS